MFKKGDKVRLSVPCPELDKIMGIKVGDTGICLNDQEDDMVHVQFGVVDQYTLCSRLNYELTPLSIDEAIAHCVEIAQKESCTQCAKDHQQLADWLMELKDLRAELNDNAIYIAELEAEISKLNAQHMTRSDVE